MNIKESGVIKWVDGTSSTTVLNFNNIKGTIRVNGKQLSISRCQCCNSLGKYKVESGSNNLVCVYCGSKQYY